MYLKKLELVGFKSFADRTEFTFPSNVTAIVGPNGCGKSNIVDAFKWIFGEQSAKGLRGEEMKDVIFNGTATRKPTGMAEVTLVFDNDDRTLDIEYSEVAITRRLFRSGESEYLINKQKCRLRDIKELFLGTGLGASHYSMLEQGKIDVLLQASNQDRRIIFEEASGISKYRVKKAETLRALQRTEENLARLGDIIDEVEKRIHRVKVQAGRARRYRQHYERLRALRIRAALEDYRLLLGERVEVSSSRFLAEFRMGRLEDLLRRLQQGLDRKRDERRKLDESLADLQESLREARTRRERTEERIAQDRRRLGEIAGEIERELEEHRAGTEARNRIAADLDREIQEKAKAEQAIASRRDLLQEALQKQERIRARVEEILAGIAGMRQAILEIINNLSRVGNRMAQLSSELGSLGGRRERTQSALEEARREAESQESLVKKFSLELDALRAKLEEIDGTRGEMESRADARRAEIAHLDEELDRCQAAHQDRRARIDVLKRIEQSREGVGKGVAAILAERDQSPRQSQVLGMIAELVQVERKYARAVESVLGEHAQSLVVLTQEGGLALLRRVQDDQGGGVEVIALDRLIPPGSLARFSPGDSIWEEYTELPAEGGVLGYLRDRIRVPEQFRPVMDALLGNVVLVEDLLTAVALSRNGLRPYRIVTLDGALVEPWGAMAVTGNGVAGGMISRKSEMEELSRELERLDGELLELRSSRHEKASELDEIEKGLQEILQAREAEILRISSAENLLLQAGRDRDQALREVRVGESELREIAGEEERLQGERNAAGEESRSLELRHEEEKNSLAILEGEAQEAEGELKACQEALTELKVRLAEAEERDEGLRRSIFQFEENLAKEDQRLRSLEEQMEGQKRRQVETEKDLCDSEAAVVEIRATETELAGEVARMEAEERNLVELEAAFCDELDRVRQRSSAIREERESLNLQEQEGKLKRNSLVEKISDEYGFDLAQLAEGRVPEGFSQTESQESPDSTGAVGEDGAPAPEAGLPDFMREDPDWNREASDAEIRILKDKIRRIGNVNLEALDELQELEERHRFMVGQRDDLRKAERDLREIIAEINRTSRELFLETFESVQQHFNDIFRKCFGGGMAELVLEDGADVLEAGIEIVARPPGKKLTSLSLMSGGEKTMTTIALLFAIFRSRPSPFCLLDEVDAPLDENNVRRFVVLLRDFIKESQFIIITHNKITMAEADSLYGITMEERGVSKRVAVEFESYEPDLASSSRGELSGTSGESGEASPV